MRIKFVGTGKALEEQLVPCKDEPNVSFVTVGVTITGGTSVPARQSAVLPGMWSSNAAHYDSHFRARQAFSTSICDHPTVVNTHSI